MYKQFHFKKLNYRDKKNWKIKIFHQSETNIIDQPIRNNDDDPAKIIEQFLHKNHRKNSKNDRKNYRRKPSSCATF